MFQSIILARALCMCITSKIIFQMGFFMYNCLYIFYSHVNYSVTKISNLIITRRLLFKLT